MTILPLDQVESLTSSLMSCSTEVMIDIEFSMAHQEWPLRASFMSTTTKQSGKLADRCRNDDVIASVLWLAPHPHPCQSDCVGYSEEDRQDRREIGALHRRIGVKCSIAAKFSLSSCVYRAIDFASLQNSLARPHDRPFPSQTVGGNIFTDMQHSHPADKTMSKTSTSWYHTPESKPPDPFVT